MTKADITEKIQANTGFTRKDSADLLETVFSIMKQTLESGEKIKVAGFGSFDVKQKKDRRGRNPQTGDSITPLQTQTPLIIKRFRVFQGVRVNPENPIHNRVP